MKSFYVLEISVEPGGARLGLFFVYNTLKQIQAELETNLRIDLQSGMGLLYCYGEDINLLTYLHGEERQRINLLPYIRIEGEDGRTFALDENAEPVGVDSNVVCQEDFLMTAQASVDWNSVPVLPLTGERLQPDEAAEVRTNYGFEWETLEYGFNDREDNMSEEAYREDIAEFDATRGNDS